VSATIFKTAGPDGRIMEQIHRPTFYPGAVEMDRASLLELKAGENLAGMNLTAAPPVPTVHVRGKVVDGATLNPLRGVLVRLLPRVLSSSVVAPEAASDANGNFDIPGAMPGSYFLVTQTPDGSGRLPIDVGETDLAGVTIANQVLRLTGRVDIEGSVPTPANTRVDIRRFPDQIGGPRAVSGRVRAPALPPDGSFELRILGPGDYRVSVQPMPANGYVKSMRLGPRDVLNSGLRLESQPQSPLVITIATDGGSLEGRTVNGAQPVFNATVALVPDVALGGRIELYKSTQSDIAGRFQIQRIAPGD
jgi:hypothetical protein